MYRQPGRYIPLCIDGDLGKRGWHGPCNEFIIICLPKTARQIFCPLRIFFLTYRNACIILLVTMNDMDFNIKRVSLWKEVIQNGQTAIDVNLPKLQSIIYAKADVAKILLFGLSDTMAQWAAQKNSYHGWKKCLTIRYACVILQLTIKHFPGEVA